MNKSDVITYVSISVLIIILFFNTVYMISNNAHAESIFIDQYRPIGTESVVQVNTEEYITRYTTAIHEVNMTVNGIDYTGTTNKYGYIAFPIKLTDNVFESGMYNMTISFKGEEYNRELYVIENRR